MTVLQAVIVLMSLAIVRFGIPVVIMLLTNSLVQWRLGNNYQ